MTPDLAALRAAYASDPDFTALFARLARGKDGQISCFNRYYRRGYDDRGARLSEAQVRRVFGLLAEWKFGTIVDASRKHRVRLLWHVRIRSAVAAAQGKLAAFRPRDWVAAHPLAPAPRRMAPPPRRPRAGPRSRNRLPTRSRR